MMNKCVVVILAMVLVISLLRLPSPVAAEEKGNEARALYFSVIPKKNLDQQIAELRPLLDLLEQRLNRSIVIIKPQSYQSVIEGLVSQSIDFAVLGPASYAYARVRDQNIDAFASFMMNNGYTTPSGEYYNSVLVARSDSGYSKICDLRSKIIAMTDPASTSGSVIPNQEFSHLIGQSLTSFFAKQIYTGSHDRSVNAVITGKVDAAFVASSRLDDEIRNNHVKFDELHVLWTSQPIHYDPFVFGGSVDEQLRKDIRAVFFSQHPSLNRMYQGMQVKGLVAVENSDYQPIHDIVAKQLAKNN